MAVMDRQNVLRELEDQKHALDQSAIVAATDRNGRITYVNNKFCEISGYDREELLGQNHRIVNSGHHSSDFFADLWSTIAKGGTWRGEVCNRTKSGHIYWVQTTIVPFLDPEGRPYQYLSIRQDISALKEAEQMILEQQSKLVAASKLSALGELSAALTHEINNPLGVILGRAEMIKRALASPAPKWESISQMVDAIETTGRRIEKIMRTVRALAHGGESEPLQRLSVKALIDSALDIIGARVRNSGIRLELSLHDPERMIECRPTEIFQILINLMSNAHDAVVNTEGPWIRIVSEDQNGGVRLSVVDSGQGIPSHVKEKLFQPFFTTKQLGVGTGLGLTISNSLAMRNGARLWLDETSAQTCFSLSLPLRGSEKPLRA